MLPTTDPAQLPDKLRNVKLVGRQGFEPWTNGLKVRCSTAELPSRLPARTGTLGGHCPSARLLLISIQFVRSDGTRIENRFQNAPKNPIKCICYSPVCRGHGPLFAREIRAADKKISVRLADGAIFNRFWVGLPGRSRQAAGWSSGRDCFMDVPDACPGP